MARPPARIKISKNKDGKLLSQLELPNEQIKLPITARTTDTKKNGEKVQIHSEKVVLVQFVMFKLICSLPKRPIRLAHTFHYSTERSAGYTLNEVSAIE